VAANEIPTSAAAAAANATATTAAVASVWRRIDARGCDGFILATATGVSSSVSHPLVVSVKISVTSTYVLW
jgi:hypothetical protein